MGKCRKRESSSERGCLPRRCRVNRRRKKTGREERGRSVLRGYPSSTPEQTKLEEEEEEVRAAGVGRRILRRKSCPSRLPRRLLLLPSMLPARCPRPSRASQTLPVLSNPSLSSCFQRTKARELRRVEVPTEVTSSGEGSDDVERRTWRKSWSFGLEICPRRCSMRQTGC